MSKLNFTHRVMVNGFAAHLLFPDIRFQDFLKIQFVCRYAELMMKEESVKTKYLDGRVYYWLSYSCFMKNFPYLGISKETCKRYFNRAVDNGFLVRHPDNKQANQTYFALGKNFAAAIDVEAAAKRYHAQEKVVKNDVGKTTKVKNDVGDTQTKVKNEPRTKVKNDPHNSSKEVNSSKENSSKEKTSKKESFLTLIENEVKRRKKGKGFLQFCIATYKKFYELHPTRRMRTSERVIKKQVGQLLQFYKDGTTQNEMMWIVTAMAHNYKAMTIEGRSYYGVFETYFKQDNISKYRNYYINAAPPVAKLEIDEIAFDQLLKTNQYLRGMLATKLGITQESHADSFEEIKKNIWLFSVDQKILNGRASVGEECLKQIDEYLNGPERRPFRFKLSEKIYFYESEDLMPMKHYKKIQEQRKALN